MYLFMRWPGCGRTKHVANTLVSAVKAVEGCSRLSELVWCLWSCCRYGGGCVRRGHLGWEASVCDLCELLADSRPGPGLTATACCMPAGSRTARYRTATGTSPLRAWRASARWASLSTCGCGPGRHAPSCHACPMDLTSTHVLLPAKCVSTFSVVYIAHSCNESRTSYMQLADILDNAVLYLCAVAKLHAWPRRR